MELGWRHALAGMAVLFVAFLLFKMRPRQRRGRALAAELQAARDRVRAAATTEDRVAALCDAGALAASGARRTTAAAGFFLRAMRADPASPRAIEQAVAALARPAPRMLEKILWRRLSVLPWDGDHRAAAVAAAVGLRELYAGALRDRSRAEIMRKLSRLLEGAARH